MVTAVVFSAMDIAAVLPPPFDVMIGEVFSKTSVTVTAIPCVSTPPLPSKVDATGRCPHFRPSLVTVTVLAGRRRQRQGVRERACALRNVVAAVRGSETDCGICGLVVIENVAGK